MSRPIQSVVVLGGGSAGLLSALTLKSMLPSLSVTIVHSSDVPAVNVGESTTSLVPRFLHQGLGLDVEAFYREVQPSWKLGIRFVDWGQPGTSHFYYPFDGSGNARTQGLSKEESYFYFADGRVFSHFTELMEQGLSPCFPQQDGTLAVDPNFGYHVDTGKFTRHLEATCRSCGITIINQPLSNIAVDGANVQSLGFEDGSVVSGDLFVDSSGFRSRLLGDSLSEPFISYADDLFCDTAVFGGWARDSGVLPYTSCVTMDHGWSWQIELSDRVSRGYVFSSAFCDAAAATDELRSVCPLLEDEVRTVQFRSGRYQRTWVNNVVAIGNASGFVEPLESTGLHMIAVTARSVAQALIDCDLQPTDSLRNHVSSYLGEIWDDIRDCLTIHFAYNATRNTPFWEHCKRQGCSSSIQPLIDFYLENGPSSLGESLIARNSIFRYDGYLANLIGQQVTTEYKFQPSSTDRQRWQAIKSRVRETTLHALSMDQALSRTFQ
ncbi:MAG: FAD-dependent oxidoreductase [Planctomycetota bacterium]